MNRWLPVSAALTAALLLSAAPALAQYKNPGINLSWDQCHAGVSSQDKTFACSDEAGDFVIIGSFGPPLPFGAPADSVHSLTGEEATIDLISQSSPMPDWWNLETGGCRDGNILMSTAKGGG